MIRPLSLLLILLVGACTTTRHAPLPPARPTEPPALVMLISIDGFRPDYLGQGATPVLDALARDGASGAMQPSFPSVTFPNHYTLVTGRHPDRHGIVSNRFDEPTLGTFQMSSKETAWWDQAEPIWVTAERSGIPVGAMFWPGSEAEIRGVRPSLWSPFDSTLSGDARVDRVLSWQDRPGEERPRLGTLYFDIVDTAGHNHGPRSRQVQEALASVDASIGRLVEGLKARRLFERTVLIIVSDHGMAETAPERVIVIDDLIEPTALRISYSGAVVLADPVPGREDEVAAKFVRSHDHMVCMPKAEVPARFVYGRNPRVPAVVCLVEPGWLALTRDRPVTAIGGAHGYDNQSPDMQALFIAHGPGVVAGRHVQGLRSVDIQPLIGALLGISVPDGDGDGRAAATVLDTKAASLR